MSWSKNKFKESINSVYKFPCNYSFKFLVPNLKKFDVLKLVPEANIKIKNSSRGNYSSITLTSVMNNADEIIYIYEKANKIKKIISL
tara:strand:+ start:373 stop:633 length:261 start_codon:yes stop_codon:yes gene_type:complete